MYGIHTQYWYTDSSTCTNGASGLGSGPQNSLSLRTHCEMATPRSAYDAFSAVDKIVAKPVLGSDGAASWQEFRKGTKELQRESVAPALQVKKADRLGTGLATLEDERSHERKLRVEGGEAALGAGYTTFKRKHDAEEAAEKKRRKQIEKKVRPEKKPYFQASETFCGWRFDYVFTTRDRGTGYYWDGTDSIKKLNGFEDFPEPSSEPSDGGAQVGESEQGASCPLKNKKKSKKRATTVVVNHDPNNPLEQVANAIRRRNEAIKQPPAGLANKVNVWETASDPSTGKTYYFNRSTGQQQWDPPAGELPEGWKSSTDAASGKVYYFHTDGTTTWVRPPT